MANISDNRTTVSWSQSGHAENVRTLRMKDTPENRAKLADLADEDRLPSAVVDLGADVLLLSGATLNTVSPRTNPGGPRLKADSAVKVDGAEGTVLSTDDGFSEIDASHVVVAVLDSGLDTTHPAFEGRIVKPYNAATGSTDVTDQNGHGTHVAGIVAGEWGIRDKVGGVAPDARIMPVKVFGSNGRAEPSVIANGVRYAADNGAKVINMSLGADEATLKRLGLWQQVPELEEAIAYARAKGVVVIAASGNDGKDDISTYYPASSSGVLTVGAVNAGHSRAGFSNGGDRLDLTAPGVNIVGPKPGRGAIYDDGSGTSAAAPYVAGAAALVIAQHPDWTGDQVVAHLKRAVDDRGEPGKDIGYGHGEINLFKAAFGEHLPATPQASPIKPSFGEKLRAFFGAN